MAKLENLIWPKAPGSEISSDVFNLNFETAYRLMLSELLPSLLHELNNPLTALNALPFLIKGIQEKQDEYIAEISRAFRKANGELTALMDQAIFLYRLGVQLPYAPLQPILQALLKILKPRFRRVKLNPELHFHDSAINLGLSPRQVCLILYGAIESCLQIFHTYQIETSQSWPLKIQTAGKNAKITLTFRIPEPDHQSTPEALEFPPEPIPFTRITDYLAPPISGIFHRICQQIDCLLQQEKIPAAWSKISGSLSLQFSLPKLIVPV